MRRMAALTALLSSYSLAFAGSANSANQFINSRQGEVERLAENFYSTRLDDGKWTRNEVQRCGAFTHHAFTSFVGKGASVRFVAIYDLDHAPATSLDKPWQGGIRVLRLKSLPVNAQESSIGEDVLLAAFNLAIAQENSAQRATGKLLGMDSVEAADCFVHLSGNEAERASVEETSGDRSNAPLKITTLLIPLTSGPGFKRTEHLEFDDTGSITKANVVVQRMP